MINLVIIFDQLWHIVTKTLGDKCQWNSNQYTMIFIKKNALDNVLCEISAISSWLECVNLLNMWLILRSGALFTIDLLLSEVQQGTLNLRCIKYCIVCLFTKIDNGVFACLAQFRQSNKCYNIITYYTVQLANYGRISKTSQFHAYVLLLFYILFHF